MRPEDVPPTYLRASGLSPDVPRTQGYLPCSARAWQGTFLYLKPDPPFLSVQVIIWTRL